MNTKSTLVWSAFGFCVGRVENQPEICWKAMASGLRFMRDSPVGPRKGVLQIILNRLAVDADTEWLLIDSARVRAHQRLAGEKGVSPAVRVKNLAEGFQ